MKRLFCVFLSLLIISVFGYPQKKNKKDIIIAIQIPEIQLKTISTDELLENCLNYPYLVDVMFAQNIPLMFKYIRQEYNGFNELFGRQDAADKILNRFLNFEFQKIDEFQEDYEKGLYVFKFCYLNLLLAQDDIINKLGDNYKTIRLINNKYSETNNENLIPFRDLVTVTFVGYNILMYFENTELGKSSVLLPLVTTAQTMHISSLDFIAFNRLSEFVTTSMEGK